jgi:hypothetical protein
MKVVLDKVFPLAASADDAWRLLQDIETVAGCMPGAKVTERIDDTHYKGTMTVRLGPATMSFKGDIEVLALDAASRSLRLAGKGTDAGGGSAASMDLTASVRPTGLESCELTGKSEVTMSGKVAALGGRLMVPVSEQMLKQFVANFSARLGDRQQASTVPAPTPGSDDPATSTAGPALAPTTPPPKAAELNGFAFAWAVLRDWVRGLFSRKTA